MCVEEFAALLRNKGLRSTPYRRAVFLALEDRPHATVVEVMATLERIASDSAASAGGAKAASIEGFPARASTTCSRTSRAPVSCGPSNRPVHPCGSSMISSIRAA